MIKHSCNGMLFLFSVKKGTDKLYDNFCTLRMLDEFMIQINLPAITLPILFLLSFYIILLYFTFYILLHSLFLISHSLFLISPPCSL